jgi:hypothetical protein
MPDEDDRCSQLLDVTIQETSVSMAIKHTRCNNLIPGMPAVCHWVPSQANLSTQAHLDMFQPAFTWGKDQMSFSLPNHRGSSMCPWYTVGRKMSDKNTEQQINIKLWTCYEEIVGLWMAQVVQGRERRCPCTWRPCLCVSSIIREEFIMHSLHKDKWWINSVIRKCWQVMGM